MSESTQAGKVDRRLLQEAVGRLNQAGIESFDVNDALEQVVRAAVELFGLTGAGLMIIDGDEILRYVVATDPGGEILESVQEQIGQGPCVDSLYLDTVITTEDASNDPRWPVLGEKLRPHPIGGVLGVPVRLSGAAVAALNVYLDRPHSWDGSDIEALSAFGRILETVLATSVLANRRDEVILQLQRALDHRVEIERAVGLLMGRHGLDAVGAFNELRRTARSQRRKVIDVARELLEQQQTNR
jgi:GAF domain-containing protein